MDSVKGELVLRTVDGLIGGRIAVGIGLIVFFCAGPFAGVAEGKNKTYTCASAECTYNESVGGAHSDDYYISCSTGLINSEQSYCKSKATNDMECDYSMVNSNEFRCHCKNKQALASEKVEIEVYCASN